MIPRTRIQLIWFANDFLWEKSVLNWKQLLQSFTACGDVLKTTLTHLVVNDYELIDQSCSCYLFREVSIGKVVKVVVVDVVLLQP